MAEISFPFTADSAGGGAQMVSQAQWQKMAHLFATDRIDTQLVSQTYTSTDLPFGATVTNGTTVSISPGNAVVGGFYYQLTAAKTVTIAANAGTTSRIDLIVLRADLAASAVNLAVIQGQAAASPITPAVTRTQGGKWELPLYQVNVPASGGSLTVASVMTFDTPGTVAIPWGSTEVGSLARIGSFVLDMDNNTNDTQTEYFRGRDGFQATRHLGKSRPWTPTLLNVAAAPETANCTGTWRWAGPGVVYFTASISNTWDNGTSLASGKSITALALPQPAANGMEQTLHGFINNPLLGGNRPNAMSITGRINVGEQTKVNLWSPSFTDLSQGLDGLTSLPGGATLSISGTYLTNVYGD